MSTSGEFLFMVAGLVAVVSAVLTVTMRTPLRAALTLLVHVISLAGLYLSLHAHLLAAIQMLVYAGAVVVLFVFVIMLIGPGVMDKRTDDKGLLVRTFGVSMVALVTGTLAYAIGHSPESTPALHSCPEGLAECGQYGGVNAVAHAIFIEAPVPFELVSALLTVAIIAAIAIARGRNPGEKDELEARQAALATKTEEAGEQPAE